ncbi:type 1 glutamine amidotransferase domain-containing protein [Chroococcidiopsis sp. TS-821]|uniref:type 1 glutamine amidotransferase domain-containing protein n=1 Tax=Chroococcidiopsis sp. TS-821 TaxID=1378066 RepID=UPI000CEECF69|nr:type 1 glutamine amidotransferase domain-containing protein [Chroococcidiopsis sp. TS-821]PPS46058.1 type 1 glutamine amidotransferase domain-containing protein [Chroococcidiopsis sp. TS-821]
MTNKKILIAVTSHEELGNTGKKTGFYLSEVTHPYDVFTRAGYDVDFVSPKGGKAPMDGVQLEDPLNKAFLDDPDKVKQVENTLQPSQVDPTQYDAIFYAGGHGTMWDFPNNEQLAQIAANIYEQGGVVGAVCHGPAGLLNIKLANGEYLIKGKTVSGFTNEEEAAVELTEAVPFLLESALKERGAEFTKAANFEAHVVKSDRLVTGQNPASAAGVAEQMLQLIENPTETTSSATV